ncbi:ATFPG-1/ATFPG-2/ATMMH-1/ATMMH-2/FPG-1/FPG-2 [Trichophaea hybrida]|nr:ATFPG-1/ATFPG-2/ATMMH-1/ATMMH-2/FPG-1/FPG-2 [Trichophaea hybrida]
MPEIGEVARIVGRLNRHLVGKTISSVDAQEDPILFKDTTASEFASKLQGRTVQAAKQHGKYFWLVMDKPPHPLLHLGMTGWIYIKSDPFSHYKKPASETWPPKFHKFIFKLHDDDDEIAFVDSRRLARVRIIDHDNPRSVPPLNKNGPDPVKEPVSLEWLREKLKARKVPVKAWLLDQSAIAGIGNWVGDEILYHARLHPECYTHNLEESHISDLHKALCFITKTAVETDADSSKFPKNWLFLHRWGKGKKGEKVNKLPTGEKVEFLTVGGRTSAYIRGLQRKVSPVVGEEEKGNGKRKNPKLEDDENSDSTLKKKNSNRPKKVSARGRSKKPELTPDSKNMVEGKTTEVAAKEVENSDEGKLKVDGLRRSSRRLAK